MATAVHLETLFSTGWRQHALDLYNILLNKKISPRISVSPPLPPSPSTFCTLRVLHVSSLFLPPRLATAAGPWWLLSEEPDTMFRLWSTPVHRWLSSCVYRPTVDYYYCGSDGDKEKKKPLQRRERGRRGRVVGMTAAFVCSSAVHEAVTYVAMRCTCWPFNTFCLLFAVVVIAPWDAVYPVISEISEAAAGDHGGDGDDELSMVSQPLPLKKPVPTSSSSSNSLGAGDDGGVCSVGGDLSCPQTASGEVVSISGALSYSDGNGDGEQSFVVVGGETCLGEGCGGCGGSGGGSGVGAGSKKKKKPGSEWRGWGAVAFFVGASLVAGLAVDFLAWQWWRDVLLR